MGLFTSIATAVAPKLLGGLLGGKSKTTKSSVDYVKLRDNALKAGFNPLTALRSGGAAGFTQTTQPALSTGEFLADAIGAGFSAAEKYDPHEKERGKLEIDLMKEELRRSKAETGPSFVSAKKIATSPVEFTEAPKLASNGSLRPVLRPDLWSAGSTRVFLPNGSPRVIPKRVADSLMLESGSYINAGQYAELVGELRGEGETAVMAGEIGTAIGVPLFGSSTGNPNKPKPKREKQLRGRNRARTN